MAERPSQCRAVWLGRWGLRRHSRQHSSLATPVLQTQHSCHCQRIRAHPVSHASPTPFPRLQLLPQARLVCQRRHQRAVRAIVGAELVVLARRVAREVGAVRERALVVGLHKVRCRVARALHGVAELGQPVRLPRRRLCPRLRLALARLHLLQPQLGLLHPEAGGAPDPGEFTPERRGREGVQRGRTAGRRPTTKGAKSATCRRQPPKHEGMRVVEARCALCWPHSRGKGCGQGPAAAGGRAPQEIWSGVMPACSDRRAPKKRKTERNTKKIGTEACALLSPVKVEGIVAKQVAPLAQVLLGAES